MSDFPDGNGLNLARTHGISKLTEKYNSFSSTSPIIRRKKGSCLYDIDGYKYTDFSLHHGSVLAGHQQKVLTKYIKNAVSTDISGGQSHKLEYSLIRYLSTLTDFSGITFFENSENAFHQIISSVKPSLIGVNSGYLRQTINKAAPELKVETAQKEKNYPLLFLEPLEFDQNLKPSKIDSYKGSVIICVEDRTAWLQDSLFLPPSSECDLVLCSKILSNGLNASILFHRKKTLKLSETHLPMYKTSAILETLKWYRKNLTHLHKNLKTNHFFEAVNQRIFKLRHYPGFEFLLKEGIYLTEDTGFLSAAHTSHDLQRLYRALKKAELSVNDKQKNPIIKSD